MALKQSMARISRDAKLSRLGAAMALSAAKSKGDSDAFRAEKFKNLWKKFKEKISRKYGARGKMMALRAASSSNKKGRLIKSK